MFQASVSPYIHPAVAPGAFGSPALEAEQPSSQGAHVAGTEGKSTFASLVPSGEGHALQPATHHSTSSQQFMWPQSTIDQPEQQLLQNLQSTGQSVHPSRSMQIAQNSLHQNFWDFQPVAGSTAHSLAHSLPQTTAWEATAGSTSTCTTLRQHQCTALWMEQIPSATRSSSGAIVEMKSHPIDTHQPRDPQCYDSDSEADEAGLACSGSDELLHSPTNTCLQQRLQTEAGIVHTAEHCGMSYDLSELAEALDHRFEALMLSPDQQVPLLHNNLGRKLSMHGLDGTACSDRWGPLALCGSRGPSTCGHRSTATSASGGAKFFVPLKSDHTC
jgi:hypothetical protein